MEHLQQIEDSIMLFLQSIRNPFLSAILVPITKSGNHGYIMIALILLTLFFKSERKTFFTAALGLILGSLVTIIFLKPFFMRPRPYAAIEGLVALVKMKKDPNSFPSGHTTAAFAMAMGWQLASEKKWLSYDRGICHGHGMAARLGEKVAEDLRMDICGPHGIFEALCRSSLSDGRACRSSDRDDGIGDRMADREESIRGIGKTKA